MPPKTKEEIKAELVEKITKSNKSHLFENVRTKFDRLTVKSSAPNAIWASEIQFFNPPKEQQ